MDTLLLAALSNAAVVAVLAPVVAVFGRVNRRPALVHSLWLLVFLKLLTPPLWPVSLSGLILADASVWYTLTPTRSVSEVASTGLEQKVPADRGGTVSWVAPPEERANDAREETAAVPAEAFLGPAALSPEAAGVEKARALSQAATPADMAMSFSWRALLLSIWLFGSAVWLALAGYRVYCFKRLLRLTQRAPAKLQSRARQLAERLGLRACPGVWVVPARVSPMLWALAGEPRLLVPASLLERLTAEQWDTLLAHELAHLRRGDHWVRFLELAALGLYWWHPMVWWARRELREAEEQCCDAWVVWALPGAAETYATALVEAVTYLSNARSALPAVASGIGHMHLLRRRLTMIMRGTTTRALSAAGSLAVLGLAAVLLPLYPSWAQTQHRPEGVGEQQEPSGTATTAGKVGAADDASSGGEAQDQPRPETPAGGVLGAGAAAGGRGYGPVGVIGVGRQSPQALEDAQDEVDLLRVQLDLRRAEQGEVQARLRQAQNDRERLSRLSKTGAVDVSEPEHATTEVEVQKSRLHAKEAQIKEAELRLRQAERRLARLRAPAPGYGPMGGGSGGAIIGGGPMRGMPGPGGAVTGPSGSAVPGAGVPGGGIFGPGTGAPGGTIGPAGLLGGPKPGPGGERGAPRPSGAMAPGGFGGGLSGGLGGGLSGAGFGGMGPGMGSASAFDLRLREVEKKLQSLLEEMKTLREEQGIRKQNRPGSDQGGGSSN